MDLKEISKCSKLKKPAAFLSAIGVGSVERYDGKYIRWFSRPELASNYDATLLQKDDYLELVAPGGTDDIILQR